MNKGNTPYVVKILNIVLVVAVLLTTGVLDPFVIMATDVETLVDELVVEEDSVETPEVSVGPTIENAPDTEIDEEVDSNTEVSEDENLDSSLSEEVLEGGLPQEEVSIEVDNIEDEIGIITEEESSEIVTYATGDFDIRLLEIQPGNKFNLDGGNIGSVIKNVTLNNKTYRVLVEKISMPEFIGKITQINGYYDIIVIGNKTGNSGSQRDYSAINFSSTKENDYKENDITQKKAREIVEFIESGQLVYIDQSIFVDNLKNSNLYTTFNPRIDTNLIKTSSNNINLQNIVTKYLEKDSQENDVYSKKPSLAVTYKGGDERNASIGSVDNRFMQYSVTLPNLNDDVILKLYLDMNGDGLYQDKECYITETIKSNQTYSFTYEMGEDFIGLLDWKVQIEQSNGVKSYSLGQTYFKTLVEGERRPIKVLQLTSSNSNSFNLNDTKVLNKLNGGTNTDYIISVDQIDTAQFNQLVNNKVTGEALKKYNMVIIGFEDSYNGNGTALSSKAIDELKFFIESGQSVMFTHDTITIRNNKNYNMMKNFRDYVGQSRFVDFYRPDGLQTDIYKKYNAVTGLYEARDIPHISLTQEKIFGYSLNGPSQNAESTSVANGIKSGNVIYETNQGLITQYPFEISSNVSLKVSNTHTQYYQLNLEDPDLVPWYNLTGSGINQYDSRNNYYTYSRGNITFSGTGHTGGQDGTDLIELELFANTIVKAERGANHKPIISADIKSTEVKEIGYDKDYSFNVTAKDIDNDKVKVTVKINGVIVEDINDKLINQGELINVPISKELFIEKNGVFDEILVTVDAVDIQGASAVTTIYKLKPIKTPHINVDSISVNGLVGDAIIAEVEYQKLYDPKNQITDVEFEKITYNSNVLSVEEKLVENQKKTYLITPKKTLVNEKIEGIITYKLNGKEEKTYFTIYVNVHAAQVKVNIQDSSGNTFNFIDVYAKLTGSDAIKIDSGSYTFTGSNNVRILSDVTHELSLSLPTNYELVDTVVKEFNSDWNQVGDSYAGMNFTVNYDKPNIEITVRLRTDLAGEIRILEIEPADKFKLTKDADGLIETGTEIVYSDDEKYKIIIDHITMPEFIGEVEKLNGKYDVIVIGRYVHNWSSGDTKNQSKYKDYNFTKSDSKEENDITNLKATEIIDFINSGQLVYVDKEIFNTSIKDTKLYRNFNSILPSDTLIKDKSISELSINDIVAYYTTQINSTNKQINLQVVDATPSDVTTNNLDVADGIATNRSRTMIVSGKTLGGESSEITINLYLDLNGDGLFKDDEIAVTRSLEAAIIDNLELNYNIHQDFLGLLSWKLEVVKKNGVITYQTGNMNFHRLPERPKKQINVLQITNNEDYTNTQTSITEEGDVINEGNLNLSNKNYEVLDLSNNTQFQKLLNSKELKDYNISIDIISQKQFNAILSGGSVSAHNTHLIDRIKNMNGYYNMIITGFADVYTATDGNNNMNSVGWNKILDFIQTGQGLMVTHDVLNWESFADPVLKNWRYYIGQSRYNNISVLSKDFDDDSIIFDSDYTENRPIRTTVTANSANATGVYQTNEALITSYPFNLIPDENNEIRIRRTHSQYYQLNLEDPDIVAWYTLSEKNDGHGYGSGFNNNSVNRVNPYDVRNSYYTYSRKNITFSGTGEQTREYIHYPDSELMLFVNTIIKAERGANHAPTVEVQNLSESTVVSKKQENLTFTVIPYDMDLDKMSLSVRIEGLGSNNKWVSTGISLEDGTNYNRINGQSVPVNFDIKNKLNDYSKIKVLISATDENKATSQTTEIIINLSDQALLDIQFSADKDGYLIGDQAILTTTIKGNGTTATNGTFRLVKPLSQYVRLADGSQDSHGFVIGDKETVTSSFEMYINDIANIQTDNSLVANINGEYSYCLKTSDTTCLNIPQTPDEKSVSLNIKRGQVVLNFRSNIAELFERHQIAVQLLDRDKNIIETQYVSSNSKNVIFNAVKTGEYRVRVVMPENFPIDDYQLEEYREISDEITEITQLQWDASEVFDINYTNNVVTKEYAINEVSFDLNHGVFIKQNTTGAPELLPEGYELLPEGYEAKGSTLVNFGATYTTKQTDSHATLTVDSRFIDFKPSDIQVFQIVEQDNLKTFKVIKGATVSEVEGQTYMFDITLPSNVAVGTNVFIFYTALAPNETLNLLTNSLMVGVTTKDVSIKVKKDENPDPRPDGYLPDLF